MRGRRAPRGLLAGDVLRRAFADAELRRGLKPVIGVEQFSTVPAGPIATP